ncbi:YopX family protein [Bacillus pseudomycoides]|uniref:YopX family protein n=1 Tax=Bacillus bingmayongensis TaxID=1150157 RepID=A0ABU5K1L6_9BACI|nr:YopX family protein [Bacillus pseudomycoides]
MREIKFRAWDGTQWIYSECVSKDSDGWSILCNKDDSWYACLEPQQYTGLLDKNFIEIYEEDIVYMVGVIPGVEIDGIGIVKFIDGSYIVENMGGNDGWELFQEGAEIKVIGNKFDNPELFKN